MTKNHHCMPVTSLSISILRWNCTFSNFTEKTFIQTLDGIQWSQVGRPKSLLGCREVHKSKVTGFSGKFWNSFSHWIHFATKLAMQNSMKMSYGKIWTTCFLFYLLHHCNYYVTSPCSLFFFLFFSWSRDCYNWILNLRAWDHGSRWATSHLLSVLFLKKIKIMINKKTHAV